MPGARAPASIGAGDDFEDMAVRVIEIDAAPVVPMINL